MGFYLHEDIITFYLCLMMDFWWLSVWRRSGTTRAKNGRGESPIVVVGRIDVVGVVEVETAVGMAR